MAAVNESVRRVPLIAGNWKMNLDHLQAIAVVQKLAWTLKDAGHDYSAVEVAVFDREGVLVGRDGPGADGGVVVAVVQ